MAKHIQTIRQQFSVFDHFVRLALKGLNCDTCFHRLFLPVCKSHKASAIWDMLVHDTRSNDHDPTMHDSCINYNLHAIKQTGGCSPHCIEKLKDFTE